MTLKNVTWFRTRVILYIYICILKAVMASIQASLVLAFECYGDKWSDVIKALWIDILHFILNLFENLESQNAIAVKKCRDRWIFKWLSLTLYVFFFWITVVRIIFIRPFSKLLLLFFLFFFLSGGSYSRTWNFHFYETKTWGGKQVYPYSEAHVYHGREVSADPWTQTKQSIYSW